MSREYKSDVKAPSAYIASGDGQSVEKRAAADNEQAAKAPVGGTYTDRLFGEVTLVGATNEQTPDGWDTYLVNHSGFNHQWSSALVARITWAV